MKLYCVDRTDRPSNQIWGDAKWRICYCCCPKCGSGKAGSHRYPVVDLTEFSHPLIGRPLIWADFLKLAAAIKPYAPKYLPLKDGLEFGPLLGEVRGRPGDLIATMGAGINCVRSEKFKVLSKQLPDLIGVKAQVKSRLEPRIQITEFQVQGLLAMGSKNFSGGKEVHCPVCDRITNPLRIQRSEITVKRSSIPRKGDVFGLRDWGGVLLVTERFRRAASGLLDNAKFDEVAVLDK